MLEKEATQGKESNGFRQNKSIVWAGMTEQVTGLRWFETEEGKILKQKEKNVVILT